MPKVPKIGASLRSIFIINAWYFQHENQKSVNKIDPPEANLKYSIFNRKYSIIPLADIHEFSGHGGGGRHLRIHQVGTSAFSLPALKISVGCRGTALLRPQLIGVHPQAHAASGIAPFCAGCFEYPIQSFGLGLQADLVRARNHQQLNVVGLFAAVQDSCRLA